MSRRPVLASEVAEMRDMARHGHRQDAIARAFDRRRSVVNYYCADLLKKPRGAARWPVIVQDYEKTARDERAALAKKHGFSTVASLTTAYCRARRALAAAEARA